MHPYVSTNLNSQQFARSTPEAEGSSKGAQVRQA
jgi:hypothetical protein